MSNEPTTTTSSTMNTTNGTSSTTSSTSTLSSTSNNTNHYYTASQSEWKKQLITKEDPNHLHKSLGIMVLMSYIFRIYQCILSIESDMGFNTYPQYTIPTIILHFLLNASSFIFKIPAKRISSGYRIWPEYRLHSLVFLCRNLACMTLFYIEKTYYNSNEYHIMDIIIILLTMAAADFSSYCQGPNHTSGFARELDVPAITKYFFSMAQLGATAMILHGQRRYTMHFIMIIIIQGNAFLMTIRRKNLASHTVLTSIYGFALLGAGVMAHYEYSRVNDNVRKAVRMIGFLATLLRTGPRFIPIVSIIQNNKYILWIVLYIIHEVYIRPYIYDETKSTLRQSLNVITLCAVIALGYYKHYKEQQQKLQAKVIKSI